MFGRNKQPRVIVDADAMITNVQDTGTTINDNPRVKLTLQVHPDGAEPFEITRKATVSRIHIPKIGDPMSVRYDAAAPDRSLVILKRTPEQLAAAAAPAVVTVAAPTAPADPLDQIKKLNDLRQAGALTDEEFEAQKKKLLTEA